MRFICAEGYSEQEHIRSLVMGAGGFVYYVGQDPEKKSSWGCHMASSKEEKTCQEVLEDFFRQYSGISIERREAYIRKFRKNYDLLVPVEKVEEVVSRYCSSATDTGK